MKTWLGILKILTRKSENLTWNLNFWLKFTRLSLRILKFWLKFIGFIKLWLGILKFWFEKVLTWLRILPRNSKIWMKLENLVQNSNLVSVLNLFICLSVCLSVSQPECLPACVCVFSKFFDTDLKIQLLLCFICHWTTVLTIDFRSLWRATYRSHCSVTSLYWRSLPKV